MPCLLLYSFPMAEGISADRHQHFRQVQSELWCFGVVGMQAVTGCFEVSSIASFYMSPFSSSLQQRLSSSSMVSYDSVCAMPWLQQRVGTGCQVDARTGHAV